MPPNANAVVPARERILETANRLFYSEGLRATGIDRIIAESGVAKMSFYRHFPAKRDLIVAYLELRRKEWMGWFRSEVESRLAKRGAGLEVIADVLESWFAQTDFRGCTFMNSVAEGAHGEPQIAQVVTEHKAELGMYIQELAGRFGLTQPKRVNEAVMIVIEGSVIRAQMTGDFGDPTVGRMLLRAIAREYTRAK
ncbi:MAG TPA: TetR/AcrR family transcriptional regulator [Luteibacter sp.]|jgi:AcrR family transcriptional regulator|uniref:TetR/AcrR family transcriptional regulator n=1 Tax=Luteibacter sp. TaxID=1886636 RepID=UPI002F3FC618